MPLFGGLFGATVGVCITVLKNSLVYQRKLAEPWTHVMLASIGGYIGYNYFRWSDQLLVAVNEKRVERGMVPIERKRYN